LSALIIVGLLAVFVVGVVLTPFLRPRRTPPGPQPDTDLLALVSQREALYQAMETLRLEHELGSVEDVDYQNRLQEYRTQAALTMREQDDLEAELARLEDAISAARVRQGLNGGPRCGECDNPVDQPAGRCTSCGAEWAGPDAITTEGADR